MYKLRVHTSCVQMHSRQRRLKELDRHAMGAVKAYKTELEKDCKEFAGMRVYGLSRSLATVEVC